MSEIKLSYFNARGRAETARLILAHAGVRYIDQRLSSEQFATVKPKIPFGQLPTLKYEGEILCQSMSLARFLANEYGLAGNNNIENAQCDEIVDAVNDLIASRVAVMLESDDAKKSELMRKLLDETMPNGLGQLEARLIERGCQFFVGNNLTWADFHLYVFADIFKSNNPEVLDAFPNIKNLAERIEELPNISKWLKSRPETVF